MATPDFVPRIYCENYGTTYYDDGRVYGAVDEYEPDGAKAIVIHEWSSEFNGCGHTKDALRWMREQGFAKIVANGVGLIEDGVGDISTAYWQHMHSLGLVDNLIDDNGYDITPTEISFPV